MSRAKDDAGVPSNDKIPQALTKRHDKKKRSIHNEENENVDDVFETKAKHNETTKSDNDLYETPSQKIQQTKRHKKQVHSTPKVRKVVQVKPTIHKKLNVNFTSYQLQQRAREDRFVIIPNDMGEFIMMMVCDGHANPQIFQKIPHVVDEIMSTFPKILLKNLQEQSQRDFKSIRTIIRKTFIDMDEHLYKNKNDYVGGATCNLVLIDKKTQLLYNANIGDSRLILCDAKQNILFESKDHDFSTDGSRIDLNQFCKYADFRSKVIYVQSHSMSFCVSRSFGDFSLKSTKTKEYDNLHGCVCVDPDIIVFDLKKHDRLKLYLTSDGPFDPTSRLSSLQFVQLDTKQEDIQTLEERCKSLVTKITQRTTDDVTIIIADLCLE